MSVGGTSGSAALSQSGMVGIVLQVVARNSGSRVTRSALLVMSSVAKWLRWEGVNPALHAGSVRESRGGIAQVVPCVRIVPPSSVYSTVLEIQKPGRIRFRQGALPMASVVPRLSILQPPHSVCSGLRVREFWQAGQVSGLG